jgi:hypothetical protein
MNTAINEVETEAISMDESNFKPLRLE